MDCSHSASCHKAYVFRSLHLENNFFPSCLEYAINAGIIFFISSECFDSVEFGNRKDIRSAKKSRNSNPQITIFGTLSWDPVQPEKCAGQTKTCSSICVILVRYSHAVEIRVTQK